MKGAGEGPGRPLDTDDELRFHLEMRLRDYMRAGMGEEEARAAAERRLGDVDAARRACERVDRRARRRRVWRQWTGELAQDLRYALRTLRRSPLFTGAAVATLALGIGATTAVFSLVHAVLLAPLPYANPDRLVRVWETSPRGETRNVVSPGNVVDWKERARSFEALGAHGGPYGRTVSTAEGAFRAMGANVEPVLVAALGVEAVVGRAFVEADGESDEALVLMGHALWRNRFGGDPGVVGSRVVVDDVPRTVVGVVPPSFAFPERGVELWHALRRASLDPTERRSHNLVVVGLLAPGVPLEGARAEMSAIAEALAVEHPEDMTGWGVNVVPLQGDVTRSVRPLLTVVLAGALLVLLIACGNLAGLLVARAVSREREIAVRGALGAGRARIARQLLAEGALLAVLGAGAALLLAPFLSELLVRAAPPDVPLIERTRIALPAFAVAGVAALGCTLLFGLLPLGRIRATALESALRGGHGTQRAGSVRARGALLVAQVAFSVVLLVGAGLLVRSFRALQATELGFDARDLAVLELDLPHARYPEIGQQVTFYDQLLERVAALPGVRHAAGSTHPPGLGWPVTFSFAIEGRVATNPNGREDDEPLVAVTPGYFETLGQKVLEGRPFDEADGSGDVPVVILSASLARKHWPEGEAVGSRIAFRVGETPWLEVVGVVEDARLSSPDVEPGPTLYIPFAQKSWPWMTFMSVLVRPEAGVAPAVLAPGLRAALHEADPALPPLSLGTVEDAFRESLARRTFAATLVSGFGVLALLLCVVGLYGTITYAMLRERREMGLRIAIGAGGGQLARRVLARALGLAVAGAGIGVGVALAAGKVLDSLLYGVSPRDPATYVLAVGLVLAAALLTAWAPAVRAARTDPLEALRAD